MEAFRSWFNKSVLGTVVSVVLTALICLVIGFLVAQWAIRLQTTIVTVQDKMDYIAHEMAIINGKIDKYHLFGDTK